MITTDEAQLAQHLDTLGIERGMSLVVHTSLMAFGRLSGGVSGVHSALRARIGTEGTLAVPTYTFEASVEAPYDPAITESRGVGVLSEHVRQLPGAVRSASPIHNHAAVGPLAHRLATTPPTRSLGPGTDFEVLHDAGFHVLLLGCSFRRGCTYLHHMEAVCEVPYRKWIEVPRRVRAPLGDGWQDVQCRYYAREEPGWAANFDVVVEPLTRSGALETAPAPYGTSHRVPLQALHRCVAEMLQADPYALVKRDCS